ncbi:MAG TPA: Gfo/Idh/MocA family oxidoreductase [Ktedonobacterales bacterium]|jgi:predicted dehydrogenase
MSDASDLRVGVIGYGLAGSVFHAPLVASTPGMRVAAISVGDAARLAQARRDFPQATIYPTAQALLAAADTLDLVVVAAPNDAHVSLGVAVLEAGLPVVIDKPLAASVAEGQRALDAAARTGKPLSVFQNRRWDNDFLTLRRLMAGDSLGQIAQFESHFERFRPEPKAGAWRESADPALAGGLLFDLGAHLIDQALQLFGWPETVYAEQARRRAGVAVDDDSFVALRFAGGEVAHLWMSVIPRVAGPRLRVVGARGVYEKYGLDPQEAQLVSGLRPGDAEYGREPPDQRGTLSTEVNGVAVEATVESLPGRYQDFYAGVRDALRNGKPMPVDPRDSLDVIRVIEAAHASAERGEVVRPTR